MKKAITLLSITLALFIGLSVFNYALPKPSGIPNSRWDEEYPYSYNPSVEEFDSPPPTSHILPTFRRSISKSLTFRGNKQTIKTPPMPFWT